MNNSESCRLYYLNNKEKIRAKQKLYYLNNKNKIIKRIKKYQTERIEKYRIYRREYAIKYYENNKEIIKFRQKIWVNNNKEKTKAHGKVNYAIKCGGLIKPNTCSKCGIISKIYAHHNDYSMPLQVIWLCSICHKKMDSEKEVKYDVNKIPHIHRDSHRSCH